VYENVGTSVITENLWFETRSEFARWKDLHLEEFATNLGLRAKRIPVYTIYWNNVEGADLKVVVVVVVAGRDSAYS